MSGGSGLEDAPLAAQDLWGRATLGVERGASLLTAEEQARVAALERLDWEAWLVLARLTGRVARVFRVPDLQLPGVPSAPDAVRRGLEEGWLVEEPEPSVQAAHATREVLAAGCRRVGVARTGRRDALVDRLSAVVGWDDARWVRPTDEDLLLRLERWATLSWWPDRSAPVLDRMGRVRWMDYPPTGGALVPSRALWDRWEALVAREEAWTVDEALDALAWPERLPGRLDRRRALARAVREVADEAARRGARDDARRWLEALAEAGFDRAESVRKRARWLELDGEDLEAWSTLVAGAERLGSAARRALAPSGRRLARRLDRAWVPAPPLKGAPVRRLRGEVVSRDGARPQWASPQGRATLERAVVEQLARAGRRSWVAEGAPWRTIWGLWMAEALFAPVPGALPVARLDRPVDLGHEGWVARRERWIGPLREELAGGGGVARLRRTWAQVADRRIVGVDTARWSLDDLVAILEGLPVASHGALLEAGLASPRGAWRGMPDLVVAPGAPVTVEGLLPAVLPTSTLLVELKGPGDTLRPVQGEVHDRLLGWGLAVERWEVEETR